MNFEGGVQYLHIASYVYDLFTYIQILRHGSLRGSLAVCKSYRSFSLIIAVEIVVMTQMLSSPSGGIYSA